MGPGDGIESKHGETRARGSGAAGPATGGADHSEEHRPREAGDAEGAVLSRRSRGAGTPGRRGIPGAAGPRQIQGARIASENPGASPWARARALISNRARASATDTPSGSRPSSSMSWSL